MAGYNGRRVPSFSQYLHDLNTIPSPYDQTLQQQDDSFNIDAELALFTNTEFFDFDNFGDINLPFPYDHAEETSRQQNVTEDKDLSVDYLDFLNSDFALPNLASTELDNSNQIMQMTSETQAVPQVPKSTATNASSPDKTTPVTTQISNISTSALVSSSALALAPPQIAGTKRKQPQQSDAPKSVDETARLVAEEDKRRRNTAASARFRVKKKQREQALERSVKEATEKNVSLEARVSQLELENQWLKNLITEKNNGDGSADSEKKEADIALMFKKYLATHKSTGGKGFVKSKSGIDVGE